MAKKPYYFPTIKNSKIYHGYIHIDIVDHYADIDEAVADELGITRRYECEQKPRPKPKAEIKTAAKTTTKTKEGDK
jgi:hypothetical protein